VTQPHSHSRWSPTRTFSLSLSLSLSALKSQRSSNSLGCSNTHSLLSCPLLRVSGDRNSRRREACNTVPVQSTPKPRSPMVHGQPRGFVTRNAEPLYFKSPSTEMPIPDMGPPVLHSLPGPTLPRHVGNSWIADSRGQVPHLLENPECRNSEVSDLRHLSPFKSTALTKSGDHTSRFFYVHAILALTNPDSPMCDGNGSSVHLRLKPLAAPSTINGTLEFGTLLDQLQSSILFLERILCSLPLSCATETKALSL
jgi:hypothetical protein